MAADPVPYAELAMLIDGEWLDTTGRKALDVVDPATERTIGLLPTATAADLDRALRAAARAYPGWRATSAELRGQLLYRAAALVRERREEIARALTAEMGKPLSEALGEAAFAARILEFFAGQATRCHGTVVPTAPPGHHVTVEWAPVGPIAAFTPWNYPAVVPARKIGAALAAGCSVVIKPAEEAPASGLAIARALVDAGLPSGVVNVVFGDPAEVSRHLITSPVTRLVSFTGATEIGKQIARLASDGVKRSILELGGHAAVLVFDDCDIPDVARRCARGKYGNAGQSCGAPSRFYVQERSYEQFVECFVDEVANITVGDPTEPGVNMGPLANPRRRAAMADLVRDALAHGAELAAGGQAIPGDGYFWQPTVLVGVPEEARIMNEEPFGPVAALSAFATLEDAVASANRVPFGLASYVFTNDLRTATIVPRLIEVGMVGVNHFGLGGADTFFGGVKESGYGSEGGPEAMHDYMVRKLIHQA